MNKIIFWIFVLIPCLSVNAQDVIIKQDGSKIEVKVIEIGLSELKYKNFSNLNGPLYSLLKSDVEKIIYENGEVESFYVNEQSKNANSSDIKDSKEKVFIKTTVDSDVNPTKDVWEAEIGNSPLLKLTDKIEDADLLFEFTINRVMGEARVSVDVINPKDNRLLWQSKKYRGTANVYNKMGASLHGIRKCIKEGIIPAMEEKKFQY